MKLKVKTTLKTFHNIKLISLMEQNEHFNSAHDRLLGGYLGKSQATRRLLSTFHSLWATLWWLRVRQRNAKTTLRERGDWNEWDEQKLKTEACLEPGLPPLLFFSFIISFWRNKLHNPLLVSKPTPLNFSFHKDEKNIYDGNAWI